MRRCYLYPVKSDVRVKLPDYSYSAEGSGKLNIFWSKRSGGVPPWYIFFLKRQIISLHRCLVLMWKCHYLYYLKIKKINNPFTRSVFKFSLPLQPRLDISAKLKFLRLSFLNWSWNAQGCSQNCKSVLVWERETVVKSVFFPFSAHYSSPVLFAWFGKFY